MYDRKWVEGLQNPKIAVALASVIKGYNWHFIICVICIQCLVWCGQNLDVVKPVLSNHIKQDIFLAFQTCGCLLLHESSAESRSFLRYFHSAISNHLSITISISPEWMVT